MNENTENAQTNAEDSRVPLDRFVGLSDPLPEIPDDMYDPIYTWNPVSRSSNDSVAMGYWVWSKSLLGFLGRQSQVMLDPEWAEVLER